MSKAYFIDTVRSVRRSLSRFISMVAIVALGTGVFVGCFSTCPDMLKTARNYYNENNLFDIRLQSYIGIYDGDLDKIREIDGVKNVVGQKFVDGYVQMQGEDGKTYEGIVDIDGSELTLRAYALNVDNAVAFQNGQNNADYISRLTLLEGEYPDEVGECVVTCSALTTPEDFVIGKKIKMVGDDESILYSLKVEEFTIVGVVMTPYYVSFERGTTTAGSGKLGDYIYVSEDSFADNVNYYSEAYVTLDDSHLYKPYTDDYNEYVDSMADKILKESASVVNERKLILQSELTSKVISGEAELSVAEEDVDKKLADARAQLDYLRDVAENGDKQIAAAQAELEEKYSGALGQLNQGSDQYNLAVEQYNSAAYKVANGEVEWELSNEEYQKNKKEYDDAKSQLDTAYADIKVAKAEVAATEQLIASTESTLNNLKENQDVAISDLDLDAMADRLESTNPELANVLRSASNLTGQGMAADAIIEVDGLLDEKKAELAAGKEKLAAAQKEYNEKKAELDAADKELRAAKAKLDASEKELKDANKQLDDLKQQIQDSGLELQFGSIEARTEYLTAQAEIALKQAQLTQAKELLKGYEEQYAAKEKEANDQLGLARTKVEKGKNVLANLDDASWFVYTRSDTPGYEGYGSAADNMRTMAFVFSTFFFVVTLLVCLTTMTRMVQEERIQLGTLKALGYTNESIIRKYIIYSGGASVVGGIIGVALGFFALPLAFTTAWGIMYEMPSLKISFYPLFVISGFILAVALTLSAVVIACRRELSSAPSVLMRPKPPASGKRVLLERISFFWSRLSFTSKVTARNIFRSKKRFLLTVIGIAGCAGLLVGSFGVGDSINAIIDKQYNSGGIAMYDLQVVLAEEQESSQSSEIVRKISSFSEINEAMLTYMKVCRGGSDKTDDTLEVNVYVPENSEKFVDFVKLPDSRTGKILTLDDSGAIISDSFAKKADAKVGDTVTISWTEGAKVVKYNVLVSGIVENYTFHYVYMTQNYYQKVTGEKAGLNYLVAKLNTDVTADGKAQLETAINDLSGVNGSVYTTVIVRNFENIVNSLNLVISIFAFAAAVLAFVVLYILNATNVNERVRELATLKVLGFYDKEVSSYIYRENIILAVIGIITGYVLGIILHKVLVSFISIDAVTLGKSIGIMSFAVATLLTAVFSFIVNLIMHRKLKKISMVESLKSVE